MKIGVIVKKISEPWFPASQKKVRTYRHLKLCVGIKMVVDNHGAYHQPNFNICRNTNQLLTTIHSYTTFKKEIEILIINQ